MEFQKKKKKSKFCTILTLFGVDYRNVVRRVTEELLVCFALQRRRKSEAVFKI